MCKILVRANADVGIEDMRRRTPIDVAWMEIIAGSRPRKFLEELRTLFGDKDHFELRRPQLLHRIILGFSKINLEDALPDLSLDDINARDEEGKTALCWAVLSGNLSAVQALLEAGADPNICDYAKDTPLMFGAYSRNPAILTTLVAGGAKFTANDRKDTALHKAAFRQDDPRYIRPFLDPSLGADINALSDCQETPLGLATLQNHARTVKFLAKHGANIEHVDEGDKTALFDAIKYKCHEAMQALLDCGADPTFSQQSGDTLLHNLAEWGELKALEVVKSVDLSGIDVDAQNQRGLTAMQVADLRINRPKGFTDAFGELLEWIRDSQDDYQSAVSIISSDSEYETPDIKPSKLV
ncbi:ankyrin repeat-containing domain protein [Aspergillus cavernicola]|uniref:Ankyrin repeat-containing domain protein n=1 Tax=Aspergillus cavernicola TaxID=176166 RepID=A0ABR4IXY7_9EURO